MKKILVVLLILAVAGGVFAQEGEWSLSGMLEIGTRLDLDPNPDQDGTVNAEDKKATVDGIAYFDYDKIRGNLSIGYTKGDVHVGLGYSTAIGTSVDVAFSGEAFQGQFAIDNLVDIIAGNAGLQNSGNSDHKMYYGWSGPYGVDRLWGEFKFIDGMVTLVAAANSPDTEYWNSDKTGVPKNVATKWTSAANPFGDEGTFTKVDHHNYFLTNVELGALSFGVQVPNMFFWAANWASIQKTGTKFVDDALKQTILGVKFEQSPFEFAAQFQLETYGIYFGGKFFAGPITVGLSFIGVLDGDGQKRESAPNDADPQTLSIGGRVDYAGDGFGAGLKAFYGKDEYPYKSVTPGSNFYLTTIGIEPFFFYNAIPSHLQFRLDAGMYFFNETDGNASEKGTVWALQPQIFWNFLGTGAPGGYYEFPTGILIRYRLANADLREFDVYSYNHSANFLDIIFKWGF